MNMDTGLSQCTNAGPKYASVKGAESDRSSLAAPCNDSSPTHGLTWMKYRKIVNMWMEGLRNHSQVTVNNAFLCFCHICTLNYYCGSVCGS